MKKSLLALTLTAALFSCKKDIEQKSLDATDITGTGWVKGNLQKTIITPSNGSWNNDTKVAAAGVNIQVRVATNGGNGIYPNSNYASTEVFTGQTDANGNFAIAVKSNGTSNGVSANIIIEGWQGTQDTLINGVTKVGRLCNYFGTSNNVTVYKGQATWWNGINRWSFNVGNMSVVNDNNNPTSPNLGTAIVTGSVGYTVWQSSVNVISGTVQPAAITNTYVMKSPVGTKVYATFSNDPLTLSPKPYQATTDANGSYTFNFATVNAGTPGFGQSASIWVSDLQATRDTMKITSVYTGTTFVSTSTAIATGKAGVYDGFNNNQGSLFSNEVRNAVNFVHGFFSFTAN
ncbi:MAG TPA: hypothetical protein PLU73_02365 [Bacteroidia bacterium]|nr:hypothetical protein [Bacteroidia bacterium]